MINNLSTISKLLPIDNENTDFLFLESNNTLQKNLQNFFFIEFDLGSSTKQPESKNISPFTSITSSFIDLELSFSLNVLYN